MRGHEGFRVYGFSAEGSEDFGLLNFRASRVLRISTLRAAHIRQWFGPGALTFVEHGMVWD